VSDAPHGTEAERSAILLFDGVCNLCNALTNFVIRHDPPPARFRFAALQSATGRRLLERHGLPLDEPASFVVIDRGRALVRSAAVLRVLRILGLPWSLASLLVLVPRAWRDRAYDALARRRYRWFGRRESCIVPTPEIRARFLDPDPEGFER
jgi:predicted DCC family thiol-disulfide oxidoreductase YuxK